MVDDFIDRKHGRKKVEYDAPVARADPQGHLRRHRLPGAGHADRQALAGYSLGGADLLRRAMGKKKAEEMAKEKAGFLDGAKAEGRRRQDRRARLRPDGEVRRLRLQPKPLGRVRPAHLPDRVPEAHYPVEFFAALLTCDKDDTDAVVKFIAEARAMGIAVLRPDVNESETDFTVVRSRPRRRRQGDEPRRRERGQEGHPLRPRRGQGRGRGRGRGRSRRRASRAARSCRCSTSASASTGAR